MVGRSPTGPLASAFHSDQLVMAEPDRGLVLLLTKRRLERGVFTSVDSLIEAIETWPEHCNDDPHPFVWTKTAEAILAKARRARTALTASVKGGLST